MYKKKLSNTKIKENIKNISQMSQHLYKVIFHTSTCALILLSVYPGNLIGLIFFWGRHDLSWVGQISSFSFLFFSKWLWFLGLSGKKFFF